MINLWTLVFGSGIFGVLSRQRDNCDQFVDIGVWKKITRGTFMEKRICDHCEEPSKYTICEYQFCYNHFIEAFIIYNYPIKTTEYCPFCKNILKKEESKLIWDFSIWYFDSEYPMGLTFA